MHGRLAEQKQILLSIIQDNSRNTDNKYSAIVVANSIEKTFAKGIWNMIVSGENFFDEASDVAGAKFEIHLGLLQTQISTIISELERSSCFSFQNYTIESQRIIVSCKSVFDALKEILGPSLFELVDEFSAILLSLNIEQTSPVNNARQEQEVIDVSPREDSPSIAGMIEVEDEVVAELPFLKDAPIVIRTIITSQMLLDQQIDFLADNFDASNLEQIRKENERLQNDLVVETKSQNKKYQHESTTFSSELRRLTDYRKELESKIDESKEQFKELIAQEAIYNGKKNDYKLISSDYNDVISEKKYSNAVKCDAQLNQIVPVNRLYRLVDMTLSYRVWDASSRKPLQTLLDGASRMIKSNLDKISKNKLYVEAELKRMNTHLEGAKKDLEVLNDDIEEWNQKFAKASDFLDKCNQAYRYIKSRLLDLEKQFVFPQQVAGWKEKLNAYFDKRKEKYGTRDFFEGVGVGFIGLFGSDKKTQLAMRTEFKDIILDEAFNQYLEDGDKKKLVSLLSRGDEFNSRVDETSDQFPLTLKGQLREIATELSASSSSKLKQ